MFFLKATMIWLDLPLLGHFLLLLAGHWENYLGVGDMTKVLLVFRGIRATRCALWGAEIHSVSVVIYENIPSRQTTSHQFSTTPQKDIISENTMAVKERLEQWGKPGWLSVLREPQVGSPHLLMPAPSAPASPRAGTRRAQYAGAGRRWEPPCCTAGACRGAGAALKSGGGSAVAL